MHPNFAELKITVQAAGPGFVVVTVRRAENDEKSRTVINGMKVGAETARELLSGILVDVFETVIP